MVLVRFEQGQSLGPAQRNANDADICRAEFDTSLSVANRLFRINRFILRLDSVDQLVKLKTSLAAKLKCEIHYLEFHDRYFKP